MAFLVRSQTLLTAAEAADPQRLYQVENEPALGIFLAALKNYRDQNGFLPGSPTALKAAIRDLSDEFPVIDASWDSIETWAEEIYALDPSRLGSKRAEKERSRYLREFLGDFRFKPKIQELLNSNIQFEAFRESLQQEVMGMFDEGSGQEAQVVHPLASAPDYINEIARYEIGVQVLSSLLDAGLAPTEVTTILGPTGGGKSTLAVQLGVDQATQGHRVLHFTLEESAVKKANPMDPDDDRLYSPLTIRALGAALDITRSEIKEAKTFENLSREAREGWKKLSTSKNLQNWEVVDFVSADRSQATLSALLQKARSLASNGSRVSYLVIDPLWPLVLNTAQVKGRGTEPKILRAEAQNMMETIVQFAEELECHIVVAHQLGASAAEKAASSQTAYGAAEIRSLNWRVQNCLVISKQNKQGYCEIILAKGRNTGAGGTRIKARLDGNACKFVVPDGVEKDSLALKGDKNGFLVSEEDAAQLFERANTVPGEDSKAEDNDA